MPFIVVTERFVFIWKVNYPPSKKCSILVTVQSTLKLNYNPVLSIRESACLSASGKSDK